MTNVAGPIDASLKQFDKLSKSYIICLPDMDSRLKYPKSSNFDAVSPANSNSFSVSRTATLTSSMTLKN